MRWTAIVMIAAAAMQAAAETPLASVRVVTGLSQPVCAAGAPGDVPGRLFVVQKNGQIRIVEPDGTIRTTPFLNISTLISNVGESGFLSMVFDPNYATNGYFYVNYNPPGSSASDTAVARYRRSAADPNVADPSSAAVILRFPYGNRGVHRAGWMGFDTAGYLYVSTGDGGEGDPDGAAQDLTSLRGKVLRVDVNGPDGIPDTGDEDGFPADANKNYRIPVTNPFVGTTNAQEIWAYGFRNPWRCSFDRLTRNLWIGDVGQSTKEEIDFVPAGAGGRNFGWKCMEGTGCTNYPGCTCPPPGVTAPVLDYPRAVGGCVIGGYVYRGCAMPDLRGTYFYADYVASKAFSLRYDGTNLSEQVDRTAALVTELHLTSIVAFGEDSAGELYICAGSSIYKIVPRSAAESGVSITQQPADASACYRDDVNFATTIASSEVATGTVNYRWYKGNVALSDGPTGYGSTISGAMSRSLMISDARGADAGIYACHITTPCETVLTRSAVLTVCAADYNCDATVDFFDYLDFVDAFAGQGAGADFNADGVIDFFDYLDFVDAFSHGCP